MGHVRGQCRKKSLRAHWGEDEPEPDPDPPLFLFEALFRVDPEEAFFHAASLPRAPTPTGDPWDISLHDYEVLSRRWLKYPPPHIVASAFVSKNEKAPPESKRPRRPTKQSKQAQEAAAAATYDFAKNQGISGVLRPKSRTAKEQGRMDLNMALVKHMSKPGAKLSDFKPPWET